MEEKQMARTNRNNQKIMVQEKEERKRYQVVIYARLSLEDNGIDEYSIENQITMLKDYVRKQEDLELKEILFDNGYTGTNFERPAFTKMMERVKKGIYNCIVVKDLSRFGRNYVETGRYLEYIFPNLGIRFISVTDQYDSEKGNYNEALILALKNVYHHTYSKDLSRKIGTLLEIKKRQGLFLGAYAPYGYKKSEQNRHQLEVDEETAPVISMIFQWYLNGYGTTQIARMLNDKGVPNRSRLLYERGLRRGIRGEKKSLWSGSSIYGILTNPNYYGCLVVRKYEKAYYKGRGITNIPKEDWEYIEETHDALISKEVFDEVQRRLEDKKVSKKNLEKRTKTENILKGFLICGKCGSKLQRDSGYYNKEGKLIRHSFICGGKYKKEKNCTLKNKREEELLHMIFKVLKVHMKMLFDTKELLDGLSIEKEQLKRKSEKEKKLEQTRVQLQQIKQKLMELYMDYKKGVLSENGYILAQKKYSEEQKKLEEQRNELKKIEFLKSNEAPDVSWMESIVHLKRARKLTRAMCEMLLEKVVVYDGYIEIHYKYQDEFQEITTYLESAVGEQDKVNRMNQKEER